MTGLGRDDGDAMPSARPGTLPAGPDEDHESAAVRRAVTAVPQPLVRQAVLVVPLLIDLVVVLASGRQSDLNGFYLAGGGVLALATLAAVLTSRRATRAGRRRVPVAVASAILLTDLAAIGLMQLVSGGNGLMLLAVLPAMWLGADLRMRGVGLTLVGTTLLVSAPALVYFDFAHSAWSRSLLLPVVVSLCSLTVAGTGQVWARQNLELERQGRRLEDALSEVMANRALNDAIVSTVDVGLVALDRDGEYKSVNPRHADFMRLAFPTGHAGRAGQLGEVFSADHATRLRRDEMPTVRAMNGEKFADLVIWVGEDRANQKALSVSAGPVLDAEGSFDGAVLVYKDITDLMAALKVKDEFVASVSHELRTPLTSIMGFLDLVLDEADAVTPAARRQLDVVKRNSVRLMRLVGDLLFTAQVDEGHLALTLGDVDLAAMLRQALADHAPGAAEDRVSLHSSVPVSLVLRGDPTRVRQLVDNLLSNAIKYTPPGGSVTVRARARQGEVVLMVTDTGIGISVEDQRRLFTRFFRTQDVENRAIQGIGLGLAITKSIVDAHEGRIQVASRSGRGSTFVVSLPTAGPDPAGRLTPAAEPGAVPGLAQTG